MNADDRAIGAFIGLVVGDALGTTVEFKDRDSFPPVTDMVGGGVFRMQPGEWTDDTAMAICLAENIIAHGTVDPTDLLHRFFRWWRQGENSSNGRCFDIGTTTKSAINDFERRGYTYEHAPDDFFASGNGSIMRLAPVALRWRDDLATAMEMAKLQSLTTHGSKLVLDCCEDLVEILVRAINDEPKEALMPVGKLREIPRDMIESSGYCVTTLTAARWCVANTDSFDDAVLLAVNLGDDADTVGAVTGQIAGALYGLQAIRPSWVETLAQKDRLLQLARDLLSP